METIEITKAHGVFVRCNSGGVFHCTADWDWRVSNMSDYDVWLVCGGRGRLDSMGRSWEISAGDCFFVTPGMSLYACHEPQTPLSVVSSHLDFVNSAADKVSAADPPPFHTRVSDLLFIERLMRKCVTCFLTGRRHQADMWLTAVVSELKNLETYRDNTDPQERYAKQIHELCGEIAANPNLDYRISDLAARLHICPDHFSRVFRKTMKASPIDFIINCRMEHAKSLLLSSNYPVSMIADMCGYKSVYYFSRHFKNYTAKSPTQFRTAVSEPQSCLRR